MYSNELLPLPDGPMIAAASPGVSENVTPDSTGSGARGVGYSLMRSVTCSKTVRRGRRGPRDQGVVEIEQPIRGALNAVVLPDAEEAALPEALRQAAVLMERMQGIRQRGRIVGRHQQAAAGVLDDFRERAAARL